MFTQIHFKYVIYPNLDFTHKRCVVYKPKTFYWKNDTKERVLIENQKECVYVCLCVLENTILTDKIKMYPILQITVSYAFLWASLVAQW